MLRRIVPLALTVVVSLTVALALCELALRAYLYGVDALWPPVIESIRPIGTAGIIRTSPDLELQYELLPNLDVRYKKVRLRTNSQGLADEEYRVDKPAHTFRVAVIGDSFTMPDGVALEDAYHSVLEDRFNGLGWPTTVEFVNFGVSGYQLPQYVAMLDKRALAWSPDLILVGFSTNDFIYFDEMAKRLFTTPYVVKPPSHPFFDLCLLQWGRTRLLQLVRDDVWIHGQEVPLAPIFRQHVDTQLTRLGEISRRTGIPLLIAFLAYNSHGYGEVIGALREITAREGLLFFDTSTVFPPDSSTRYWIYPADGHPNRAAHRVFADTLFEHLLGSHLVHPEAR
jgi:lysophospholipase L1-like esterase